jgi:ubiquinone/menaquinone biosynthesis C-methylase UbiE
MKMAHEPGAEQEALWNGPAGHAWVAAQELMDGILKPFQDLLVDAVSVRSASNSRLAVLDVGCGTGATTLAISRLLAEQGRIVGIDISKPMIAVAEARAERESLAARFIGANAQAHTFEPATFDMVVSRFGVMFFDDPVRAFANLRRAAKNDATLWFVAWRGAAENPFMTTAERAAAALLPNLPPRRPDAPGQFAFASADRVRAILEKSGWAQVELRPLDVECAFPQKELVRYFTELGPVGLILHEADEQTRRRVVETVRAAFDPYVHGAVVRFTAACWIVDARAGDLP